MEVFCWGMGWAFLFPSFLLVLLFPELSSGAVNGDQNSYDGAGHWFVNSSTPYYALLVLVL
jgi:hypothetical protein